MEDNKKLLLPKTPLGKICVLFFCLIWWLLCTQPVLQIFNNMAKGDNIVWVGGMPINFVYIIVVAVITVAMTFVVLLNWKEGDE